MTLKQAYIELLNRILKNDCSVENYLENMGEHISFSFNNIEEVENDKQICADIDEMRKVFFTSLSNKFGHSYGDAIITPIQNERNAVEAIIKKLSDNLETRNAVLTFSPYGNFKIPCISVVQFLVRNNTLNIFYTARSQDIFKKFPLDAVCIADMGKQVAKRLNLRLGSVYANIISAHIYQQDKENVQKFLKTVWMNILKTQIFNLRF